VCEWSVDPSEVHPHGETAIWGKSIGLNAFATAKDVQASWCDPSL